MAIEFHCSQCGKLVRAGEEHAGKRGRCPHCHQSVYIPTPSKDLEPLRLAPLDENEERERQRLLEESLALARKLRRERDVPPEVARAPRPEPKGDVRLPSDMEHLVTEYALAMAAGRLDEARALAADIRAERARAEEVMQRLTMDELLPPKLAKIPRPVLIAYFKQLREG